jgi:hypothetical protein
MMIKMTRFRKVVVAVVLFSIIWGSVFAFVNYWTHTWTWEVKVGLEYTIVQDFPPVFFLGESKIAKITMINHDTRVWTARTTLLTVTGPAGFNKDGIVAHWAVYDYANNLITGFDIPFVNSGDGKTITWTGTVSDVPAGFSGYHNVTVTILGTAPLGTYSATINVEAGPT